MTDNEIIKALICHIKGGNAERCADCPLYEKAEDCDISIPIIALDLINRQKEKIEELEKEQRNLICRLMDMEKGRKNENPD